MIARQRGVRSRVRGIASPLSWDITVLSVSERMRLCDGVSSTGPEEAHGRVWFSSCKYCGTNVL